MNARDREGISVKVPKQSGKASRGSSSRDERATAPRPSRAEFHAMGKTLRGKCPRASVLEAYAGKSVYANHGQRVVNGYRLMQSVSDIFLGWTVGKLGRHFYVRQLKDMKLTPLVELFSPVMMIQYGELCGWALARAHARSGEPAAIGGYLGKSDAFDKAIAKFAIAYADQSERDHEVLRKAGRVEVITEPE
jgi:hypothetical protein